jgi:hypothetical protein
MPAPSRAASLVATLWHDTYPTISPTHALANSAVGLCVAITGAGRGIGRAQALAFAQAGAARVLIGARSAHELDEVEQAIHALGQMTEVVKAVMDVTDEASVARAFAHAGDVNGTKTCSCFPPNSCSRACSPNQQRGLSRAPRAHARGRPHRVVEDVGRECSGHVPALARCAAGRARASRATGEANGHQHVLRRVDRHVPRRFRVPELEDGGEPFHRVPSLRVRGRGSPHFRLSPRCASHLSFVSTCAC